MSTVPMGELTSKLINFQYDKDTDYWNELYLKRRGVSYADRAIPTGYEFGTDEKNVKLLFAGSPLVGQNNVAKVVTAIYKNDSNGEQRMGSKLRLLMLKNFTSGIPGYEIRNWITGIGTIDTNTTSTTVTGTGTNFTSQVVPGDYLIVNGKFVGFVASVGSNTSMTLLSNAKLSFSGESFMVAKLVNIISRFPYAGHLDDPYTPTIDLNFQQPAEVFYTLTNPYPSNNLYTAYWEHFIKEILNTKSGLMTCFVNLTAQDMYDLDFSKYIHIDGSLYRLNKVIDYDTESSLSTKTELLKVIKPLT